MLRHLSPSWDGGGGGGHLDKQDVIGQIKAHGNLRTGRLITQTNGQRMRSGEVVEIREDYTV